MKIGSTLAVAGAAMLLMTGCSAQSTGSATTSAGTGAVSSSRSVALDVAAPVSVSSVSKTSSGGNLGWRGNTRTKGCTSNHGKLPAGARTRTIADVDGDGKQDRLVIDEAHARVGVLTHSGKLSLTSNLWGAGPGQQRLYSTYLSDGITALLSSDQRSVSLGYYVSCGIVIPKNHDTPPRAFSFGLYGHDGVGTGVRCQALPDSGGQHQLLGVDAVKDGNSFLINTTVISTSNRGVTADSGLMRTDGEYGKNTKAVAQAKTVNCGGFVHSSGK